MNKDCEHKRFIVINYCFMFINLIILINKSSTFRILRKQYKTLKYSKVHMKEKNIIVIIVIFNFMIFMIHFLKVIAINHLLILNYL